MLACLYTTCFSFKEKSCWAWWHGEMYRNRHVADDHFPNGFLSVNVIQGTCCICVCIL